MSSDNQIAPVLENIVNNNVEVPPSIVNAGASEALVVKRKRSKMSAEEIKNRRQTFYDSLSQYKVNIDDKRKVKKMTCTTKNPKNCRQMLNMLNYSLARSCRNSNSRACLIKRHKRKVYSEILKKK